MEAKAVFLHPCQALGSSIDKISEVNIGTTCSRKSKLPERHNNSGQIKNKEEGKSVNGAFQYQHLITEEKCVDFHFSCVKLHKQGIDCRDASCQRYGFPLGVLTSLSVIRGSL